MRNFITIFTITLITSFTTTLFAKSKSSNFTVESYVSKYRLIAQLESHRSGIPASIILAQAVLESGFGNSDLCQRSKNHFGIKWKSANDGDFVYSMDDDYDEDGKHIPSKFINYGNDLQSFHHHTDYLLAKAHYKILFRYDCSDFTNWAYGLRECGYSTDRTYGAQLVQIIKRYNLNTYDLISSVNQKRSKVVGGTKTVMSILSGKNLWSILLNKQSFIMEQDNMAFAKEPKINQSMTISSSKPVSPSKSTQEKKSLSLFADIRTRFEIG
jgi:Mannosyl-glycoprotein endo-beta-N-acetylglucosaminidase